MSPFDLTGRVAIVTGGNGGIGLGMAIGLAQAGASVLVVGRNNGKNQAAVEALAPQLVAGARAEAIAVDLNDPAAGQRIAEAATTHFGRIDILINNAGMSIRKQPEDYTVDEFRQVIEINLTSAFACCQAAFPALKVRGGKIVNIGSMTSIFGAPFAAPYSSSKGGIVQLTRALATAWARFDIQVNAVLPGWIDTELTRKARVEVDGLHDRVLARTPAGRWGEPQDLAGIAVFLASDASDFVTGAAIPVDGGYAAQA
ncbi:MAG: SDR family NAD(P)-dependent oxidoreductase [Lautropia sp.]